jgi:hypothetical protein
VKPIVTSSVDPSSLRGSTLVVKPGSVRTAAACAEPVPSAPTTSSAAASPRHVDPRDGVPGAATRKKLDKIATDERYHGLPGARQ